MAASSLVFIFLLAAFGFWVDPLAQPGQAAQQPM
jgi:hypothetical protein